MLSKMCAKRERKQLVRSLKQAFRPRLEGMEERWVPDITDIVFTPTNGVPIALAQPVGPGALLYNTTPAEAAKIARQLPGMVKTSVRQAHTQATWELNQLVTSLYPHPQLHPTAVAMLSYVNPVQPTPYTFNPQMLC
ncbi:MAG: hypothetical protein K2X82_07825 [Gemmataceae bacterium]|nr:hypothetical protein [Gemmataceae bacterium]